MRYLAALIAALFLVGCADTAHLADQIEGTCSFAGSPDVSDLELPAIPGAARSVPDAPTLLIGKDRARLDWNDIGTAGGVDMNAAENVIRESADHLRRVAKFRRDSPPPALQVAIDARHPYSEVQELLRMAQRGGFQEAFLLGAPSELPPPPKVPDPELYASLRSADPAERAMRAAQAIDEALVFCPDLTTVFGAIAAADPSMKCEFLVAGIRESSRFPCLVDTDAFITAIVAISVPTTPTTFHRVALDGEAPGLEVTEATRWGEVMKGLLGSDRLGLAPR